MSPPPLSRREFLKGAGSAAVVAGTGLAARSASLLAASGDSPFQHGVASGDPVPDGIVLWTRVTPTPKATPGSGVGPAVTVHCEIAHDAGFVNTIRIDRVTTGPDRDHTVKLDVTGLEPDREYYYRFRDAAGRVSPVGRTVTAPARTDHLRFGVVSCAAWEGGFFSAYRHLAKRRDLDFILHLGDYIYEFPSGGFGPGPEFGRVHDPKHEIETLEDYRRRHAQYKTDPDLQALHLQYPFIVTWDDHEFVDDNWDGGSRNYNPARKKFYDRRRSSYRAYFEWMPFREPKPGSTRLFRSFRFGDLADLFMLDLRQYRSARAVSLRNAALLDPSLDSAIDDPGRSITGKPQMKWLKRGLSKSRALWRIVGNPLQIAPVRFANFPLQITGPVADATGAFPRGGITHNVDSWDGFEADRAELLSHIADGPIGNVVFLTGDIHTSWVCDVPLDAGSYPATPSVAVEFVGTSVTSENLDEIQGWPPRTASIAFENLAKAVNRHIKYVELDSHGYAIADVTPGRLQMDWHYISDRTDPNATSALATSWQVEAGSNSATQATAPIS